MATRKQITVGALAAVVIVGCAIWLATRGGRGEDDGAAPRAARASGSAGGSAAASPSAPADGARPRVQRLADPASRIAMLDAIRQQRTRRTAAPGGGATAGTPAPALPEGDLDKTYIRAAVRELIPLLAACYDEGLTRDPKLGGDVVVDFTIEGEPGVGGVIGESAIDAEHTSLADAQVRECIQETMYAIEIDPPAGGGIVHVRYPFKFSNGSEDAASPARR